MKSIAIKEIKKFGEYLLSEEKSSATVEKYLRDVMKFAAWLGAKNLEKSNVLEYKRHLVENYAPASVNSMLSSINCFFDYSERYDCKVKALKVQRQTFSSEEKELTQYEYEKLLTAAKEAENERLYYLMQTICATGIRVSEVRFITAEAVKTGQAKINCKGKMRMIWLPDGLCRALAKYMKKNNIKSGCMFVTRTGKPLNRTNIWADMKKLCKTAGVSEKKVFPHNLRHLFARTYYSIQKDIVRLADILGHSNVNTTRIYTMESGTVHRRQIQKIGQIFVRT